MNKITEEELIQITGGATNFFTATFLNAVARCINSIMDVGRAIGSSLARLKNGNLCS